MDWMRNLHALVKELDVLAGDASYCCSWDSSVN